MTINPNNFEWQPETIEAVEKATLRMVAQALYDFSSEAEQIFKNEEDLVADMGEDITREALDRLGFSQIPIRLFGKIDFKKARYVFHPDYAIRQALFVDSKAEKIEGEATVTLQTSQTSMSTRQRRGGRVLEVPGKLPTFIEREGQAYLTSTIFVKYHYNPRPRGANQLINIVVAALPNGRLQEVYNPNERDTIWRAGRDAPTLGEEFRVRLHFGALKSKANWRVQTIKLSPKMEFIWEGP